MNKNSNKTVMIGVQFERVTSGNMYSGKYFGFSSLDENFLNMFCTLVSGKLESLLDDNNLKSFLAQTFGLPKIIVKILHSRSLSELVTVVNLNVPKSLKFEYAEIIFYDTESNKYNNYSKEAIQKDS